MKRRQGFKGRGSLVSVFVCIILSILILSAPAHAAEDSVCARVKLEIRQELTLERQAFDAHMRISNGFSDITLEDVDIDIQFTDKDGKSVLASTDPGNTEALFFFRLDSKENIDDVNGHGTVAPATTADIHWLMIPAIGASNGVPQGTLYYVGATLRYTIGGEEHVTEVNPDYIFVKPMPNITLDYFLPTDVYGDDAFTPEIEPPVPFSLGVRVRNTGLGTARAMKINSAQPKITDNQQGLLIGFEIIGSEVNGQPFSNSLLVSFGDIAPNKSATARWTMLCTLSGRFVEFTADWSHSDELGGELTSLLEGVNTHFLVRDVLVDVQGRDAIRDFLAKDGDTYRVYESENVDTVVTDQSASATLTKTDSYTLTMPVTAGFVYVKLVDPYAGQKDIKAVVRSDGKRIKSQNYWLSKTRTGQDWEYFINLFDATTTGSYAVSFDESTVQNNPPVLQPIPAQTAVEERQLSFTVTATDPDGTVPSLSASTMPALAQFVDAGDGTGIFTWTPATGQAGLYGITFTASDGILSDTRSATIRVNTAKDTDGDGMDDAWEMKHFGTLDRDGTGDFDRDGVSDLDEFLTGTDPTVSNHIPTVPVIVSPNPGDEVTTLIPSLVIQNSTDSNGDTLTYEYQVYADAGMALLVASATGVPEGTETTSWAVAQGLTDNAWYYWRVRASDGVSEGPWAIGSFFVRTTNDPPGPFVISSPKDGTEVVSKTPVLTVVNSIDPDGDIVTYDYELYADEGLTLAVADATGVAQGSEQTAWAVPQGLTDNTWYYWRVRACDRFSCSFWVYGRFFVNTANDPPGPFQISSPKDGAEVATQRPRLEVTNSTDPDGDRLVYTFEVSADSGMGTLVEKGSNILEGKDGATSWVVGTALDANTTYYWRARVIDEHGASAETIVAAFTVNTQNTALGIPVISSPAPGAEITSRDVGLVVATATDPDGTPLSYYFELDTVFTFDSPVKESSGELPAGAGTTAWQRSGLDDNTWYEWRVKASDGKTESPWAIGSFFVNTVNDPPSSPTLRNPGDGAWVDTLTPILAVNPVKDPDDDIVTYAFEVYADPGLTTLIIQGTSEITWWTLTSPLNDRTRYYWRAQAVDEHNAKSEWSEASEFFVKDNGIDDPPAITIIEPSRDYVTNAASYTIRWEDADPDDNADIAIFYDTDQTGDDGTLIVSGLKEDPDGAYDTYAWDIAGITDGIYYVYAFISDATTAVTSYGPGGITIDKTPPLINSHIVPAANAHGWHKSDVTVSYTVSDSLSGIDETTSSYADDIVSEEGAGISVGAEVYDKAGNRASITEIINLDTTLPTITVASRLPQPTGLGWNTSPVLITYAVSDALSGVDEAIGGYEDDEISTEGENQSATGTVVDKAGNSSSVTVTDINIDLTAPAVKIISPVPDSIINGPFEMKVTATDSVSGVAQVDYQVDNGSWKPLPATDPISGTYATTWAPVQEDEGSHTIYFRAVDKAGNVSEPVSVSIVIELATPFEKLTGTISVSPNPVYRGQEVSFTYTLTNKVNKPIPDLAVRVLIVDPGTGGVVKTLEKTISVPAASTATGNLTASTMELAAQPYTAKLQIASPQAPAPRIVASEGFEVVASIEVTETIANPINLLVWVNDKCHRTHQHKDKDEDEADADGKGNDNDKDKDKDKDKNNDKDNDKGAHGKGGKGHGEQGHDRSGDKCIRVDMLEAILAKAVGSYLIVYDDTEFEEELRNPYYTDILILGDHQTLTDQCVEELRERVNSGTGIISSLWLKQTQDAGYEKVFGVRRTGVIAGSDHTVNLVPSPITGQGVIKAVGKAAMVEAMANTTIAGWIEKGRHRHTARCKTRCPYRRPAIVLNTYGLGTAIYLAFDLGQSLNTANYEQIAALLTNSISHVHRNQEATSFVPYQLVPIDLTLTGLGGGFDVRVSQAFPSELVLYEPSIGAWITESPWTITIQLGAAESRRVRYYALTPNAAGTYTIETEVGFATGGSFVPVYTSSVKIVVDANAAALTADIIAKLRALSVGGKDRWKVKLAIKYLERVKGRKITTAQDVDRNIQDILKAVDYLLQVKGTDITQIRVKIDSLLRVEQGLYFLFPES